MKKLALALGVTASLLLTNLSAAPWDTLTSGWTQQTLRYDIQAPYNLEESARFQKVAVSAGTEYRFEIRKSDKPFKIDSKTEPRTEMRILGLDYQGSGKHQFEADIKVPDTTTTNVIIFQIKQTKDDPVNVYTTLRIIGNNLCVVEEPIRRISRNTWYHINVIHDSPAGTIKIYVDGTLEKTVNVAQSNRKHTKYFKCGTYNMSRGVVGTNKIVYRNIKVWRR
jgi:hypothetical protein